MKRSLAIGGYIVLLPRDQFVWLTRWGRVTHIWVGNPAIIGSNNVLSPGRRQAIICTNDGMLLFGPLGTNFNEILVEILTFSFQKIHLKMSSGKWRPFCPVLNVFIMEAWWHIFTSVYFVMVDSVDSSPPGENGRHFADDIFKRISLNENVRISIQFSLKFVSKGPIENKSALVQAMDCRLFGDKPLPEPMLTKFTDAYMRH